MSKAKSIEFDQETFDELIGKYSSQFNGKPSSTKQLVSFCKEYCTENHNELTYSILNPYFIKFKKIHLTKKNKTDEGQITSNSDDDIDWEKCWDEYIKKYKYPPKIASHLYNFVHDEMKKKIKYKEARLMFNKLNKNKQIPSNSSPIDGDASTIINTDADNKKKNKKEIKMKILHTTTETSKNEIKSVFNEVLKLYNKMFKKGPSNEWNLYNFIKEETPYKVKYSDVKFILNYAIKHGWIKKRKKDDKNDKENKPIKKKRKSITENEYKDIICKYKKKFKNPPRNAAQVMNFANEFMNKNCRYGVIRIAFTKYAYVLQK